MLRLWINRPFAAWLAHLPSQCVVCRAWPSRPVCDACVSRFAPPTDRCGTCALPVPPGVLCCGECVRQAPPLDACLAACAYAWPWPDCIAQFKFRAEPGWAGPLATLMRSAPWVEPALERCDLVLPMPLSRERLRERGFNQALELARRLSPGKTDARLLLRTRETPAQSDLTRAERLRNLRGAFALEPLRAEAVRDRRIVLVDDVMTSGASLFSAAQVLRAAGATHITAVVLARTPLPG
ncbi:ComF family protein [Variovorax sp. PAMC 28711]|uniref:ComF family protein n=1 Tax=Variovorax sp. PAMC 28711 TaxID=1795631 RepID=UPI00078E37A3|nr:ComF family protein [Variovorax sp. PAMC 28711]AMM25345.1 phosphoribosyltransferase [Variovorax sp. PAMC 28711]